MKIFVIHNHYQQAGGEDQVFTAETRLLESRGHTIYRYETDNHEIERLGRLGMFTVTIWNRDVYRNLRAQLAEHRPQIAHFHNTFPLISPAAYQAAWDEGIPVVQTLHNYRLLCPNALFFREGRVCEDCLGKSIPWPGVLHACYRNSRPASAAVASLNAIHWLLGTWRNRVNRYIVLSEFSRQKFIQGGLSPEKLMVKPNFLVEDPGERTGSGTYGLFAGRLSEEKGLYTLLDALAQCKDVPFKVIGDGPLLSALQARCRDLGLAGVEFLGHRPHAEVLSLVKEARFLALPTECYENFPMSIVEAYACGVPVLASRLGAVAELVVDGQTGLLFSPGDANDLALALHQAWLDQARMQLMGREARQVYEQKYTAEANYRTLKEIYKTVIRPGESPSGA